VPQGPWGTPPCVHFTVESRETLRDLLVRLGKSVAVRSEHRGRHKPQRGWEPVPNRVANQPGKCLVHPDETVIGISEECRHCEEVQGKRDGLESLGHMGQHVWHSKLYSRHLPDLLKM
jgi:hypothetical protein